MTAPTREEFFNLAHLSDHTVAAVPGYRDYASLRDRLVAAFDAVCAERDEQRSRADTAEAERDAASAVTDAARTFTTKLNLIHAHPSFQSVWSFYSVHGLTYAGPTYEQEFAALNAALAALGEGR